MKNRLFEGQVTEVSQLPDRLFGRSSPPPPFHYGPPTGPINIVYQEEGFLVVSKPEGLLSVEGKADNHKDCLERRLKDDFPTASLVHRLDMDTSGLVIVALDQATHRHLGLQFERRKV